MTNCWFYDEAELVWGCDFSFEDYGLKEGEGVIATLSCPNCGATAEFYSKSDEDKGV